MWAARSRSDRRNLAISSQCTVFGMGGLITKEGTTKLRKACVFTRITQVVMHTHTCIHNTETSRFSDSRELVYTVIYSRLGLDKNK